jgi:hypothetical protein
MEKSVSKLLLNDLQERIRDILVHGDSGMKPSRVAPKMESVNYNENLDVLHQRLMFILEQCLNLILEQVTSDASEVVLEVLGSYYIHLSVVVISFVGICCVFRCIVFPVL